MTTRWILRATVAFFMFLAGGEKGGAESVLLAPSKDNTLYEDEAGNTSNGSGQHFFAGRTSQGLIRRGLIAFDVAGSVCAGSTIESVTLVLHVSQARGPEVEVDVHAVLADWGEGLSMAKGQEGGGGPAYPGDATWLHTFYDSDFWSQPGGDFSPTVSSSAAVSDPGLYTFDSTFDSQLVTDVQGWVDDPGANFGWLVKVADEFFPMSAKRFDTRENIDPPFQPALMILYTPGC